MSLLASIRCGGGKSMAKNEAAASYVTDRTKVSSIFIVASILEIELNLLYLCL